MSSNPKTIQANVLAVKALETMQDLGISQLLVLKDENYEGVVHVHNLIKEGIL
jgi:arabinose-5-phosphate isomerase